MATLLNTQGVRVFVPSRDHQHPPHVHVECGQCVSKWNLFDFRCVERVKCSAGDLRRVRTVLVQYEREILDNWKQEWHRRGT